MGQDSIDFILEILIPGQNLAGFHLRNDLVNKLESCPVRSLNGFPAAQVHIPLGVGSGLNLAHQRSGGLDNIGKALSVGGYGFDYRAAQLFGKQNLVDVGALLFVDVCLVQGDNHGDAQLQQLGGEEEGAAQIGGVHDVDNHIGILVLNVGAGDALFGGEGGHGVGAGQIHGNHLRTAGIGMLNGGFFLVNGYACPVADLLVAAGKGIVHGGFAGVGIAGERDSHMNSS